MSWTTRVSLSPTVSDAREGRRGCYFFVFDFFLFLAILALFKKGERETV